VLPNIPGSLLQVANTSGQSTALHWAAVNSHLAVAQAIVSHPGGPGPLLIDAHNAAGLSPLGEAELAGADEVAKWLVEVMTIEQKPAIGDENDADGDDIPDEANQSRVQELKD
jgi:ankyrin repeat protein